MSVEEGRKVRKEGEREGIDLPWARSGASGEKREDMVGSPFLESMRMGGLDGLSFSRFSRVVSKLIVFLKTWVQLNKLLKVVKLYSQIRIGYVYNLLFPFNNHLRNPRLNNLFVLLKAFQSFLVQSHQPDYHPSTPKTSARSLNPLPHLQLIHLSNPDLRTLNNQPNQTQLSFLVYHPQPNQLDDLLLLENLMWQEEVEVLIRRMMMMVEVGI